MRINKQLLDAVIYLYPTREAAEKGHAAGGTGLLVGIALPNLPDAVMTYAVSNRHVVHRDGCSVARLNRLDGKTDIIEYDPVEWFAEHPGADLAVTVLRLDEKLHKIKFVGPDLMLRREQLADDSVAPGDEVFMVGRFVNHDGLITNVPSVRFGHLSMMPLPIRHPDGYNEESFAVEMSSRAGYSGSPVYVVRSPWDMTSGNLSLGGQTLRLLGINWGFITDHAEVKQKIVTTTPTAAPGQHEIQYVPVNTGMNGVIPAWRILDLLNSAPIREHREQAEKAEIKRREAAQKGGVELATPAPATK